MFRRKLSLTSWKCGGVWNSYWRLPGIVVLEYKFSLFVREQFCLDTFKGFNVDRRYWFLRSRRFPNFVWGEYRASTILPLYLSGVTFLPLYLYPCCMESLSLCGVSMCMRRNCCVCWSILIKGHSVDCYSHLFCSLAQGAICSFLFDLYN